MKTSTYLVWIVVGIMAVAQIGCSAQKDKEDSGKYRKAPEFTLSSLEGKSVSLSDFKGKVIIVDIWDTWCPPCRMEIPHFVELYSEYQKKGLEIIGVALGREGRDAVARFARQYKINYISVFASQKMLDDYGPISGIPTTFVIDQKGRIARTYVGYRDKSVFENDIKTLLSL
ncbi:TlpA family protein disulfide reductase [candidate division KSB1 bacterium]|nr:TlpA family protein disulfide reductase [candidate division KSB1 bacterium]